MPNVVMYTLRHRARDFSSAAAALAAKLAEKVNLRRREANEKLYEALGCGGLPPGPPAPPASEKSPPA